MTFFKYIFFLPFLLKPFAVFSIEPDCELIDYNVVCTCDGRKLVQEESYLLQINSRMGDKHAKVSIPYSKKMKVVLLSAQIETEQGVVIRELKKDEITDKSAISDFSLYEDDFVKKFEMRHNFYPYRLRYSFRYTFSEFQEIIQWHPVIHYSVPTRKAKLEIHSPVTFPIKYYSSGITTFTVDTTDSRVNYRFEVNNLKLPEEETNSVPLVHITPVVRIVPEKFNWIYNGSHGNWKDYGNWLFELIRGTDDLPDMEKENVLRLIKNKTDKHDIIKVLYRYLQDNTRYVNVSIGVGGLKPYPASYVASKKYGDCKALSVYMKALLKAAGIPSYYTTIYSGDDKPPFIPDFPCHQSNHIILFVPLEKDSVFLECTNNSIPMGYLGTSTQGRETFVIEENNSHYINTPALSLEDVKETKKFVFEINAGNNCALQMNNQYRGYSYDYFNSIHTQLSYNETEDYIRERIHLPSFELVKWDLSKPNRDIASITLSASIQLQNYLKKYSTDLGLPLIQLDIPNFEQPAKRKLPLYFDYPVNQSDTFIFNLAAPLKVKLLPEETKIISKYGTYTLNHVLKDNTLLVEREFKIFKGVYPLTEYQDFFTFITSVLKADRKLIMLTTN